MDEPLMNTITINEYGYLHIVNLFMYFIVLNSVYGKALHSCDAYKRHAFVRAKRKQEFSNVIG